MKMTSTKTMAVLVAALLLTSAVAMSDDLPVQAGPELASGRRQAGVKP